MTKILLLVLLLLILVFGFGLYIFNAAQPTLPVLKQHPTSTSEVTLSLVPISVAVKAGLPSAVRVNIVTHGVLPSIVQLEIAYDPKTLGDIAIMPGDFYSNPVIQLTQVDSSTGRISFALSKSQEDIVSRPIGTLAVIMITPYSSSFTRQTQLSFLPKTMARTQKQENIMLTTYGTSLTIIPSLSQSTSSASAVIH